MNLEKDIRWLQRFDNYRKAFEMGIITDKRWMNSIEDRNLISHFFET